MLQLAAGRRCGWAVARHAGGASAARRGAASGGAPTPRVSSAEALQRLPGEEGAVAYPKLGAFGPALANGRDGLPRWPGLGSAPGVLRSCDWFGTVVFASSGAITAASCGLDLLGVTIVGTITAIGGGTIRDAVVLHKQPFWLEEYEYLLMSAAAAAATFFLWPALPSGNAVKAADGGEGPLMWWGDAIGVGAFAVIGAQNALRMCVHPSVAAVCGMLTATGGGLTRDVICGLPADRNSNGRILHSRAELYASTALVGATVYVGARQAGLGYGPRVLAGAGAAVALRYLAAEHGLGLPAWGKPQWLTEVRAREASRAG
jgi:uncharacterized membrane protein YeiH